MSTRVLITGASGQLGQALLASAPAGITAIPATRAEIDLSDPDGAAREVARIRPDILINAAAYVAVDRAESEEALAQTINGTAVGTLANALRDNGGRFVHVSTDFVFDGTSPRAYRLDDTIAPLSAYGRTKAAGEAAAGGDATVVRTAWLYGAGSANFVTTMLRLMRERDEVRVVTDQIGAPTWTNGLAGVLWGLAALDRPGVWHWSDAGVASWYDFALAIQEEALAVGLLSRQVPVIPIPGSEYPTPAPRPSFSLLDSRATREALGLDAVHWRVNLRRFLGDMAAAARA